MRAQRFSTVAAAAFMVLGLVACGDSGGDDTAAAPVDKKAAEAFPAGSRMKELADSGKIIVGTKFDQPLFGLKGLSGKPEGFDVKMAELIAGKLGISPDKIEFVETVSANREPFLQQKKVDMVIATYTINDKRDEVVDFAGPYFVAGQDILVAKGNPKKVTGPDALTGLNVCSVSGSTPASTIQTKYPQAKLVLFDNYTKCRDALGNGQVDAVTTDNVILSGYVDQAPDKYELVGKPFTQEPYGIGLPEGQEPFCDFINKVLADADKDGSYAKAFESTAGKVIKNTPKLPSPARGCAK
ncbi:MAG: putative glutamate binding protein of transporter system [Frankiales bacterium]|nr:putative glutamate binding protein of transporter system [Frankiales bacterium]